MIVRGAQQRNVRTASVVAGVLVWQLSAFATVGLAEGQDTAGYSVDCDPSGLSFAGNDAHAELRADVAVQIARRWNLGSAGAGVLDSRVVLRLCHHRAGALVAVSILSGQGPSREAVIQLYETARRAVNRAHAEGGISLPPEQYDIWRVLDLEFDATGMRFR
jgi:hypothetical protein